MRIVIALLLAVLLAYPVIAQPLASIYHPIEQRNIPIDRWTYDEIVEHFDNARFRFFNDIDRVCETMQYQYGKAAPQCNEPSVFSRPATARAYARFTILPPPEPIPAGPHGPYLIVDPLYPPYSPVYAPWEWPWR